MANYNSINEVVAAHANKLIKANGYDPADYPFQNDVNSALVQLAEIYAKISGTTAGVAVDSFSIAGALDALLNVVDETFTGGEQTQQTNKVNTPSQTPTFNPGETED